MGAHAMSDSQTVASVGVARKDPAVETTIQILSAVTQGYRDNFSVRLWDGSTWEPNTGPPGFTLVLKHPGALRAMFWPFSKVGFGESYIFDDFDVEGDFMAFTPWIAHLVRIQQERGLWKRLRLFRLLLSLPRQTNPRDLALAGNPRQRGQGIEEDRAGISFHYDRP